jgi:ferrous iron transport protein A
VSGLDELKVGARARVERIAGTDDVSVRLMEMGVLPGIEVKVLGRAPLGDPLEIELRGYRLSVRSNEASRIEVTPL